MGQTDVATDTETHTQTQTGIIVCFTDMQSQGKTQADYMTSTSVSLGSMSDC